MVSISAAINQKKINDLQEKNALQKRVEQIIKSIDWEAWREDYRFKEELKRKSQNISDFFNPENIQNSSTLTN